MDYTAILAQIEKACADFQVASARHNAEQVLLNFRQTPNILPVCKYILDHTTTPYVQFQAASAIKEGIVREYALYSKEDLSNLQNYLLGYCAHRPNLVRYVRDQLLQAFAVVTKRGFPECSEADREAIIKNIHDCLNMGSQEHLLAVSICNALVDEFSSTKASSVGLTWNFHQKCRELFESYYLRRIFEIVLQILHQQVAHLHMKFSDNTHANPAENTLLAQSVSLSEKIMNWDFASTDDNVLAGFFAKDGDVDDDVPIRSKSPAFPPNWRDLLLNHEVLEIFFKLYKAVREEEVMSHQVLQCLVQFAGLHGSLFENPDQMKKHAETVMRGVLSMINDLSTSSHDEFSFYDYGSGLLGVTQMIRQLLDVMPLDILCTVSIFGQFVNDSAALTTKCLNETVQESGDSYYTEAFGELLETWVKLVDQVMNPATSSPEINHFAHLLWNIALHVFVVYVDTRLERAKLFADDEEDESGNQGGYKDVETYGDQLLGIAILARMVPEKALQHLYGLLQERIGLFINGLKEAGREDAGRDFYYIHEHIHWLILIAGHVLADAGEGEKPLVPETLMELSARMSNIDPSQDLVVQIPKLILHLLDAVTLDANKIEAAYCSPQVSETLFWFLERWGQTYLLISESNYKFISPNIARAFGKSSITSTEREGAAVVDFLLGNVKGNLILWSAEPETLKQIVHMLSTFAKLSDLRSAVLHCAKFHDLIEYFTQHLEQLPEVIHNSLIQSIVTFAISDSSPDAHRYFNMTTCTIEKYIASVLQRPDFLQAYQSPDVMSNLMSALEMFDGLALASASARANSHEVIFHFCVRFFESFIKLISVYETRSEMQLLVLGFFRDYVQYMDVEALGAERVRQVWEAVMGVLSAYAAANAGRSRSHTFEEEMDEPYADICAILDMLNGALASEFEGRNLEPASAGPTLAEVTFHGANVIIPHINLEILKQPHICSRFIQLISTLVELYPEKLVQLPPALFSNIFESLKFGIDHAITDVARLTFRAIGPLALFSMQIGGVPSGISLEEPLDILLQEVMNLLLFKDLDSVLIQPAADALLALILARRERFAHLAQHLIVQQKTHEFQGRLADAFRHLTEDMPSEEQMGVSVQGNNAIETRRARSAVLTGLSAGFRERLTKFLMNVRGFLRVK
ncbi:uncharacterized protein VTP21DRAFT_3734 [Calcarisporiella thermophila]|uniref:uncharacterized protein n=1 Tax=Calcarisporiella thermophila TaxID=911321 RepID=UPI00374230B9